MAFSRRNFLLSAAMGGAAAAISSDVVLADAPLGVTPPARADGRLPGEPVLYTLRNGQGEHHLIGGQVATLIARGAETGGSCTALTLTGGMDAHLPLHSHAQTDEAIYVMDGRLELHLDGKTHLLTPGDYAYIPAGTLHGHRMKSWRTHILTWSVGTGLDGFWAALGQPFGRPVQPDRPDNAITQDKLDAAAQAADVTWVGPLPDGNAVLVTARDLPGNKRPYVLMAGEGERLVAADQLFSFLQTSALTEGSFFAVMTEGPAGQPIPWHYHRHHTENFFCVAGSMTMWVNGQEITLHPGDFCQVTPGTVHSYRLDSPYTKFFGWLVPAVFEPFFRYIGEPTDTHVFPIEPPAFRFDRVLAHIDELDLNVVMVKN